MNHFYVHIPFCHRVCPYCKFAVSPVVNEVTKKRYLEYLKKEIRNYFLSSGVHEGSAYNGHRADSSYRQNDKNGKQNPSSLGSSPLDRGASTLYFGGGTPSILSIEELWGIIDCFPFPQKPNREFTLESNPEDITEEKAKSWKSLGINRISLGIQSLDDTVLDTIKRANKKTILEGLEILNKHFKNINIDLILGLPYSKPGDTLLAIQELHEKLPNITHTSVYILEKERYPKEWNNHYPTEENIQKEYSEICDYLEQQGWRHYEVSNWARSGYESTHNQSYWNHSNYRGFGLSAGSFAQPHLEEEIQGSSFRKRFSNPTNFRDYFAGKMAQEILTDEQIRIETIMFGLRTFSLNESIITNKEKLDQFIEDGLLEREDSSGIKKIFPTKTGIFMLDYIMSELI